MVKERLIPWTIRHCDQRTFVGMGWVDRNKGILYLDWTRQGNAGWMPSDAAEAWAKMKGHLKDKKPRDLKAGLRNAFRSKNKQLVKIEMPKKYAEKDGRKRMLWRFLDLESELKKISNPPAKCGKEKKKSVPRKNWESIDEMMIEDNSPSSSSTLSDFEYSFPKPEKRKIKGKISRKKLEQIDVAPKKKFMDPSKPLPSIQSFIRSYSFKENMCNTYNLPLQSHDISSSTFNEARFPENATQYVSFPPQKLFSYQNGPTPSPQKTDVIFDDPDEMSPVPLSSPKSESCSSYDKYQDSQFMNPSDESRQSPHSSSTLWNSSTPNHLQNSQVFNQSKASSLSQHSHSPSLCDTNSNHFHSIQALNQTEGNMDFACAISSSWYCLNQNQIQFTQVLNQPDTDCDATPPNEQPCFSLSHDQLQDNSSQSSKISDEPMCDSLQRFTSPSFSSNITNPELSPDLQFFTSVSDNHSLFPEFNLLEIPPLEYSHPERVLGIEASIDVAEDFLDLSDLSLLNINAFNMLRQHQVEI